MKRIIDGWSDDNLRVANVLCEARGEVLAHGYRALEAVDWVVFNRTRRKSWANNPKDVILQRLQFSWTRTSDPNYWWVLEAIGASDIGVGGARMSWATLREMVWDWEKWQSRSKTEEGLDVTGGADHYLNIAATKKMRTLPKWAQDESKITRVIGKHTFFRLREQ